MRVWSTCILYYSSIDQAAFRMPDYQAVYSSRTQLDIVTVSCDSMLCAAKD